MHTINCFRTINSTYFNFREVAHANVLHVEGYEVYRKQELIPTWHHDDFLSYVFHVFGVNPPQLADY